MAIQIEAILELAIPHLHPMPYLSSLGNLLMVVNLLCSYFMGGFCVSRLSPPSGLLLLFQTASLEPRDALDFNELSSVRKIAVLLDLLIVIIIIILPFDEEGSKGMMRDCFFYTSLCHEITLLTSKLVH